MTAVSASFVITGYLLSAFCIFGAALRAILLMLGSESVSLLQICKNVHILDNHFAEQVCCGQDVFIACCTGLTLNSRGRSWYTLQVSTHSVHGGSVLLWVGSYCGDKQLLQDRPHRSFCVGYMC